MNRRELHLAMTEETKSLTDRVLLPHPRDGEERGVIGIVAPSSGRYRRTLLIRELVQAQPGDVTWADEGLTFSTSYKSRAVDRANALRAGLCFIHTHPLSSGVPSPSSADLRSDRRDLYYLGQALLTGAPLVAAIVGGRGHWSAREYHFSFPETAADARKKKFMADAGSVRNVDVVRFVGPGLRIQSCSSEFDRARLPANDVPEHETTVRLWGKLGQEKLRKLRVAISGLGGVGGILAEHLARLGIGDLIFIDFDRLWKVNGNRSQGARRKELVARAFKVLVARRVAREAATAPGFRCRAVVGSVVEEATLPDLLDCDMILNAADSPWARQVLDHISYAHLIPVVNGGTELRGDPSIGNLVSGKCEVAAAGPGHPCFECAGVYSVREASEARERPEFRGPRRYLNTGNGPAAEPEHAPSVISTNAIVAGLMELRLKAIALGTTPDALVGTQRYYPLEGVLHWAVQRTCTSGCARTTITAAGDRYELPLGHDYDADAVRTEGTVRSAQDREGAREING